MLSTTLHGHREIRVLRDRLGLVPLPRAVVNRERGQSDRRAAHPFAARRAPPRRR